MYNYNQVINGISKYIDNEIVSKLNGWQKWGFGAGAGIILSKGNDFFNKIKQNEMIKALGIIDKNDNVDIDLLYRELKKQAKKSATTIEIPLLGALTLNEQDLDKLYEYIKMKGE